MRTRDLPEGIDKFPDQRGKEGSVCLDVLTCVLFCSRTCFGLATGILCVGAFVTCSGK